MTTQQIAIGLVLNLEGSELLLIRPKIFAGEPNAWGGPFDFVRENEEPEVTISRVCLQDTGLFIAPEKWTLIVTLKATDSDTHYLYSNINLSGSGFPSGIETQIIPLVRYPEAGLMAHLDWLSLLAADNGIAKPLGISGALDRLAKEGASRPA